MMKRVVLTDSRTKTIKIFESPPWRLNEIKPQKDGTSDVQIIHESGDALTVNVNAELSSLTKRFEGW